MNQAVVLRSIYNITRIKCLKRRALKAAKEAKTKLDKAKAINGEVDEVSEKVSGLPVTHRKKKAPKLPMAEISEREESDDGSA